MKRGFTLIEVCLVMLVFGIAISSIMAFFPVSLRQANMSVTDTVTTMFADYVINSLQANAAEMTDLSDWDQDPDRPNEPGPRFKGRIVRDIRIDTASGSSVALNYNGEQEVKGCLGNEKSYLKYRLEFLYSNGNRLCQINLSVTDNKHISLNQGQNQGQTFITHVAYLGEVPE